MELTKYAYIDPLDYPILVIRFTDKVPILEDVDVMFEDLEQIMQQPTGRYVIVGIMKTIKIPSAVRASIGVRSRQMFEKYQDRELASILVSESPVMRIMMQTTQALFRPNSNRQMIVGSELKARELAKQLLIKAGVDVS